MSPHTLAKLAELSAVLALCLCIAVTLGAMAH